ncbi:hypothetical protein JB92DRAFT_3022132 [Gautieria morchelliformis]|nr:hypothetical protein JB92DRAFT_3022132 [Gautieria morchelliformis]
MRQVEKRDFELFDMCIMSHYTLIRSNVAALLTYDCFICLSREVAFMWHGRFRFATALYFLTRYIPFVSMAYQLAMVSKLSPHSTEKETLICTHGLHFVNALCMLAETCVTFVLVAQTYAIFSKNRQLLVPIGMLGIAAVALDTYEAALDTCDFTDSDTTLWNTIFLVILTLFPVTVMCLTLYRVLNLIGRRGNLWRNINGEGLTGLILFETLCMSGVCLIRLLDVLLVVLTPDYLSIGADPFILPVSSVFTAHFLLNLRGVNGDNNHATTPFTSIPISCPHFPSVIDIAEDLGRASRVVYHAHIHERSFSSTPPAAPHTVEFHGDACAHPSAGPSLKWNIRVSKTSSLP